MQAQFSQDPESSKDLVDNSLTDYLSLFANRECAKKLQAIKNRQGSNFGYIPPSDPGLGEDSP